jgi:hypothetical protein
LPLPCRPRRYLARDRIAGVFTYKHRAFFALKYFATATTYLLPPPDVIADRRDFASASSIRVYSGLRQFSSPGPEKKK